MAHTISHTNLKIGQVNRQIYKVPHLHDARKWSHSSTCVARHSASRPNADQTAFGAPIFCAECGPAFAYKQFHMQWEFTYASANSQPASAICVSRLAVGIQPKGLF